MNFLVEVYLHATSGKQITQETSGFHKERHTNTSLRCFQSLSDSPRNAAPSCGFDFELLPSRLGQAVVFARRLFSESPQKEESNPLPPCGVERETASRLNNKGAPRDLLDPARDSQSVHLASDKRFQDQHVQSPLQKGCRFRVQGITPIGSR